MIKEKQKFEIGSLVADNNFYQLAKDPNVARNDLFSGIREPNWIIGNSISGLHLERKCSDNITLYSLFVYINPQDFTFWKLKFARVT
jgi:hypothetical protein